MDDPISEFLLYVLQQVGEVVFIPIGWQYKWWAVGGVVMVQQMFCSLDQTEHRVQPLGPVLYGESEEEWAGLFRGHRRTHRISNGRLGVYPKETDRRFPQFGHKYIEL